MVLFSGLISHFFSFPQLTTILKKELSTIFVDISIKLAVASGHNYIYPLPLQKNCHHDDIRDQ
jgi:hypothetical protein